MEIENKVGFEHIDMKTAHGIIRVYQNAWGNDYPGIAVDFIPNSTKRPYQVAVIEDVNKVDGDPTLNVRVWGNPQQEDTTHEVDIALVSIEGNTDKDNIDVKCPKCAEKATLSSWNRATKQSFGFNVRPLRVEDFMEDSFGHSRAVIFCYICPHCKAKNNGESIIDLNKVEED